MHRDRCMLELKETGKAVSLKQIESKGYKLVLISLAVELPALARTSRHRRRG